MRDEPTKRRVPRGGALPPRIGWFVQNGDSVVLKDSRGKTWTGDNVTVIQGAFGNPEEGVEKLPRPYVFDSAGVATVQGDHLLILFPNGDEQMPVVLPGVTPIGGNEFFGLNYGRGGTSERFKTRLTPGDGTVELVVGGDTDDGATGVVKLTVASPTGSVSVSIDASKTPPRVEIGTAGKWVLTADTFLADLAAVLTEIVAIGAASAVPTTNTAAMLVKVQADQATLGVSAGSYTSGALNTE